MRHINSGNVADTAQMVKLVDTPASGAGDRKVVEVRVFFWAPIQVYSSTLQITQKARESGLFSFRDSFLPSSIPFICGLKVVFDNLSHPH